MSARFATFDHRAVRGGLLLAVGVSISWLGGFARGDEALVHAPKPPSVVIAELQTFVKAQGVPSERMEQLNAVWRDATTETAAADVLDRAVRSLAIVDPAAKQVVSVVNQRDWEAATSGLADLPADRYGNLLAGTLRQYVARSMMEERMCDEALVLYQQIEPSTSVDPAGLFFGRAVCAHTLLDRPAAVAALDGLLKQTTGVPDRYRSTADLMLEDLKELSEESLDGVSRLMSDSERRLSLGRAGERVQGVQDRIVATLDEMIKKIEQQQGGGGGGGGDGQGGGGNQSNGPAGDSSVKGSTAPGETDQKKFSKGERWGDLPPKDEAKARNLINRDFPSHYRQAIESYFRKLANRTGTTPRSDR
jgi:hypothetical protein